MSSFSRYIQRLLTQTAVYWAPGINTGYGGKSFAAPVEIKVRWEKIEDLRQSPGQENVEGGSSANMRIIHGSPLAQNGFLYLGKLTDITGPTTDPSVILGAFKILSIYKIPTIPGRDFIYEHTI